ncbi:MAG TPA: MFS transporter [Pseudonocardia sp.]|jgi:MFS family permease|uniref:MFS transporter n=1 Tax=Pseudonocardia sp. TaxID=60912 RepID=UPI002B4B2E62|nr:MFS transporter [Pseudonocardia sp.]HLU56696.1 MFS transporter [Pseudonocardia sp.]
MSPPADRSPTQLRRAVTSSYLGSVIEYYDFLLYATASAVVFNTVFFPSADPTAGVIASFGTLVAGYAAKPVGAALFGHFGDRIGRKRTLVVSMTVMGTVSVLIGLLPGYATIGVWAPILLVLLRILQGIALGGEWGGSVLISTEHAASRRGLWASFTLSGAPSGTVLSTLALTVVAGAVGNDALVAWGWRIPFLFSAVLLAVGLFVRAKVEETPVFRQEREKARVPLAEVLRAHPRALLISVGMGAGAFVAQGTLTVFVITYAVAAGFTRSAVLNALTISSVVAALGVLVFAGLSDRIGRRPVVVAGAVGMAAWAFAIFPLVDSGSFALLLLAVVVGQGVIHTAMFGPMAALYAELFPARVRYTGASLGLGLAGIASGLAPLVFAALGAQPGNSIVVSVVMAACCLLTVGCVRLVRETSAAPAAGGERVGEPA